MNAKNYILTLAAAAALPNLTANALAADVGSCPAMGTGGCTRSSIPSQGLEVNAAPIQWTTPAGWKELAPNSIRIANLLVPGQGTAKAEVAVTSFPGTVGTEYDNVTRWRGELGLPAVDPAEITSQLVEVGSEEGKLYEFTGASASTVVVSLRREGASWFFKMRGDTDTVEGAKAPFLDFLKSVRFTSDAVEKKVASAQSLAPTGEPNWNPPSAWVVETSGPMVLKSFSVADEKGQKAKIAVSVFPGGVGGALANVNRWRTQLGLAPIKPEDLPASTSPLHGVEGNGILVELANDKAPGGPSAMVAAIVPHQNSTWFYKLAGDESVVEREKDGFVKFVETARYP